MKDITKEIMGDYPNRYSQPTLCKDYLIPPFIEREGEVVINPEWASAHWEERVFASDLTIEIKQR